MIVPVLGKKSVIGVLSLGSRRSLKYAPDDMEFLTTTGHQFGLAVENLRLVEQILRSHRQWANTFDSIHDLVLLHDADFRVMKANHALLERLAQAPADVVGKTCEEVLPRGPGNGQGVPIARLGVKASTREPTRALAASAWSPLPRTSSREASKKAPSTWCGIPPTGGSQKKNTGCCSSRCKKEFLWPRRKASCSIAMMPLSGCWGTTAAKN